MSLLSFIIGCSIGYFASTIKNPKAFIIDTIKWYKIPSILKINRDTYELPYYITGTKYLQHITVLRGPKRVTRVYDQHTNDVSDHILPFMGPNQDWHNIEYTPKYFGYESLSFVELLGDIKTFGPNDCLIDV